jgi:hypothetical protein
MKNTDGDDILASIFEKTNNPGADVRRRMGVLPKLRA